MSLFLALALQATATLPADEAAAASRCAAVTIASVAGNGTLSVESTSRASYFAITATRAKPATGRSFAQATLDMTSRAFADSDGLVAADLAPLAQQCSTRFPLVDRASVILPADAFRRDMTCITGIALSAGMAASRDKQTGGNEAAAFDASAKPFFTRLSANRLPAGDALKALMDDLMRSIPDIGTPLAIARTCAALDQS